MAHSSRSNCELFCTPAKVNKPAREHFLNVMQYFRNIELFDCDDLAGLISRITVQK